MDITHLRSKQKFIVPALVLVGMILLSCSVFGDTTPTPSETSSEPAFTEALSVESQLQTAAFVKTVATGSQGMMNATDEDPYVNPEEIEVLLTSAISYPSTSNSAKKTYESYKGIGGYGGTLLSGSNVTITSEGLVKVGDYYAVALGTGFGSVGDKLLVTFADGHEVKVIICDQKPTTYLATDGHILEGIVDTSSLTYSAKLYGDLNYTSVFKGSIVSIEKITGSYIEYVRPSTPATTVSQ